MSKFSDIIASVLAALKQMVVRTVSVVKFVGGKFVSTTETVVEWSREAALPFLTENPVCRGIGKGAKAAFDFGVRLALSVALAPVGGVLFTEQECQRGMDRAGRVFGKLVPPAARQAIGRGVGVAASAAAVPFRAVGRALVTPLPPRQPSALRTAVGGLLGAAVAAPFHALALPFKALGALGGGGAQQQAPQQAAQEAEAQQRRADAADDARQVLSALRRIASARARGEQPDEELLERLPPRVAEFLLALSTDECLVLASRPSVALRGLLGGRGVEGIRTPEEVFQARRQSQMSPEQVREGRKAELRAAIRGAVRVRSAEEVIKEMAQSA